MRFRIRDLLWLTVAARKFRMGAKQVVSRASRRRLQFSLQALIAVTAISCSIAAVCGWRQRRQEELGRLVDKFIREMDNGDYAGGFVTAERAKCRFPDEAVAEWMLYKAEFMRSISRGEHQAMLECR